METQIGLTQNCVSASPNLCGPDRNPGAGLREDIIGIQTFMFDTAMSSHRVFFNTRILTQETDPSI